MTHALVFFAVLLATSNADPQSEIKAMNDSYVAAMISGDAHAIASHFEADAMIVNKGNDTVRGRDKIEAYVKEALAKGHPSSGTCSTSHLDVVGTQAFEAGSCSFEFGSGSGAFHYAYRYLALWHRQGDGSWLLATDVSE